MTFAQFTSHYAANKSYVPASVATEVRRAAVARVTERMQAGRADSALDFSDLILRIEASVGG